MGRAGSLAIRNPRLLFSFVGVLLFIQIAVSAGLLAAVLQLLGEIHAFEFPLGEKSDDWGEADASC